MKLLPFDLPDARRRRKFIPADTDAGDWSRIEPLFDRLEQEVRACETPEAFEQWLQHWGELSAVLDEEGAIRYIAMSCHTDDAAAEKAYLEFVEEVEPRFKPRQFRLEQAYLGHPMRAALPRGRYAVFDRNTGVHVALYRDENVPLETEEAKLGQQYQKLSGSLTVQFQGEERTLTQMGRFLEEPDRALRQEAWEKTAQRRLQEADRFEAMFDELLKLRRQIGRNAGFADYRDFVFRSKCRFDYTPADCLEFHAAIEREVMPLVRELQAARRKQLKLESLRPWDLAVDPLNLPALRPFENVDALISSTQRIFQHLDPALATDFDSLHTLRLLDLDNRKGKAPGGYQSTLAESRVPFIFMNAVGIQRDVETLLHEAGHAFHALATRDEDFYAYRANVPIEFCEVASMSMELLGNEYLDAFYPANDARRARRDHLEGVVEVFPWIATVDAFQHWIYAHPEHTRDERAAAWSALMDRFGGDVDWSGYEAARRHLWHRQLHIFLLPFYYVEYGIAQIGALRVWKNWREDRTAALGAYKRALALGGSRPLPDLFTTAGCEFNFTAEALKPLMNLLREELARLG